MNEQDLSRFLTAQEKDYATALAEIKNGRKRSHWMWYIFPQIDGLGLSSMSRRYAVKSVALASAFLSGESKMSWADRPLTLTAASAHSTRRRPSRG